MDGPTYGLLMKKLYALLPPDVADGDYTTTDTILDLISVVPFVTERIPLVLIVRDGVPIGRRRKDGSAVCFTPPGRYFDHDEN